MDLDVDVDVDSGSMVEFSREEGAGGRGGWKVRMECCLLAT